MCRCELTGCTRQTALACEPAGTIQTGRGRNLRPRRSSPTARTIPIRAKRRIRPKHWVESSPASNSQFCVALLGWINLDEIGNAGQVFERLGRRGDGGAGAAIKGGVELVGALGPDTSAAPL